MSSENIAGHPRRPRVTVGLVSADVQSQHAQDCLRAIKAHTENFSLIVLDNNRAPNFNHPRELNYIIASCATDFLFLLDDDVVVGPGWVEGLIASHRPGAGVVTPLHRGADGELSYAGVVMRPDYSGHHSHAFKIYDRPFPIQTGCGALLMIDMNTCRHLMFDEAYPRYFLDIDYGLRAWEAGLQVLCAPAVTVTHIGGATMGAGSERGRELAQAHRRTFAENWCDTGRYQALEKSAIWRAQPEIRTILDGPEELERFFDRGPQSREAAAAAARDFLARLTPFPALKSWVGDRVAARRAARRPDPADPKDAMFAALAEQVDAQSSSVILAEEGYRGFNLVRFGPTIYAIDQATGAFDLGLARSGGYLDVPQGDRLDAVKAAVDAHIRARPQAPVLLEGYRGFNLVRSGATIYAIDQATGAFDTGLAGDGGYRELPQGDTLDAVKAAVDAHINARPPQEPVVLEGYRGFNLVRFGTTIYAIDQATGAFDVGLARDGGYGEFPQAGTLAAVKAAIDAHINARPQAPVLL